jgi:hypothetical protein
MDTVSTVAARAIPAVNRNDRKMKDFMRFYYEVNGEGVSGE